MQVIKHGNTYKEICGYRGDFYETCPECGNTDIRLMDYFGEDTTIYIDKNNLTDSIHLETNADSVKNFAYVYCVFNSRA